MIDADKLLAWLATRETKNPVGRAIYEGLTTRIQAGQFDYDNDKEVT